MRSLLALVAALGLSALPAVAAAHVDCSLPDEAGVVPGDLDEDNICDDEDNCVDVVNPNQADADYDGLGDACDPCDGVSNVDEDSDGHCDDVDCDDRDPRVYPGAAERCDGVDSDCVDGPGADEGDSDGDGSPDCADLCIGTDGFGDADRDGICGDLDECIGDDSLGDGDGDGVCDDRDLCTGDDATGDSDDDGVCGDRDTCLGDDGRGDGDGDGVCDDRDLCVGDDATGDSDDDGVCEDRDVCVGDDRVGDADDDGVCDDLDCDDDDPNVRPGAVELCNGEDDDCDRVVDDVPPDTCAGGLVCAGGSCTDLTPCYADRDGDGAGDASDVVLVDPGTNCEDGRVRNGGDCDDDPAACGAACAPGRAEVCDSIDSDCDGVVDEGASETCADDEHGSGECVEGACRLACDSGWMRDGDRCVDVAECDGAPCPSGTVCNELPGAFECPCAPGWQPGALGCSPTCGDGLIVADEGCDDGNRDPGDGCTPDCLVEAGWACQGTVCNPVCGDGRSVGLEECDDGNAAPDDGCGVECRVEPDWVCAGAPSECRRADECGDGIIGPTEECDDANYWDDDGCLPNCTVDEGWQCAVGEYGWSSCIRLSGWDDVGVDASDDVGAAGDAGVSSPRRGGGCATAPGGGPGPLVWALGLALGLGAGVRRR